MSNIYHILALINRGGVCYNITIMINKIPVDVKQSSIRFTPFGRSVINNNTPLFIPPVSKIPYKHKQLSTSELLASGEVSPPKLVN